MNALIDQYRTRLKTTIITFLQYRVAMVIWLLGTVLEPVIYLVVWTTVSRTQGGTVGGYSAADFAAYFLVLMLVDHVTFTWVFFFFEAHIRQGDFSPLMMRPTHPIHHDIAENIAYKLLTLFVLLPTAIALGFVFRPVLQPVPWMIAAFVPVLLLAAVLRFPLDWTFAMIGFWTTRTNALSQMYYVLTLFLSGQVAPLTLFPTPLQVLANVLPFRWLVAFPVELLLVLSRWFWKLGVRHYSGASA
jgi:ABC-2 type transport system permease protein